MGFLSGLFGGGGDDTRTSTTSAPEWLTPHLQRIATQAGGLAGNTPEFYRHQTFADTTPELAEGLDMQANAARSAADFQAPAFDMFNRTLQGEFLDPQNLYNAAKPGINAALSGINARTNLSGGRGGTLAAEAAARAGTDAVMGQYGAERNRQMGALGMLPTMSQQRYTPGANLARIGNVQMGLDQRQIDEDMARHNFAQQAPWMSLNNYSNSIRGIAPAAGSVSTQTMPSQGGGGMGRLLGMGVGAAFGQPMMGASLGGMLDGGGGGGGGGGFGGGFGSFGSSAGAAAGLGGSLWT